MNRLYAHGKILISAEYMVLYGSGALALPLRMGQSLQRIRSENPRVFTWKASYQDNTWFAAQIDPSSLKILKTSDTDKANWLRNLIMACIELMPDFQQDLFRWDVETQLEFAPEWGFGSSSSVIALVAEWAEVNPLDLHFMISEGSGYDVACAIANGPIQYRIRNGDPHYQHVPFDPPFANHLYVAWLGTKQATAAHLQKVAGSLKPGYELIHQFSELTGAMIEAKDLASFRALMEEHEEALSRFLQMERVTTTRLRDVPGTVKSLGAWGGDCILIATEVDQEYLYNQLKENDIEVIFRYRDIALAEQDVKE